MFILSIVHNLVSIRQLRIVAINFRLLLLHSVAFLGTLNL